MYCLSEEQIAFIANDIRVRGVEMESLQQDLLDHVCCLIEQNLEANGDFEHFYVTAIRTFYKTELKEIEEETLFLLTNKNYYAMKKIMLSSGVFSAVILSFGILFKFMHWPGASTLIVAGVVFFSLLFLPLLFTLKVKERQQTQDKFILTVGTVSGILFSLSTLFKLMHWPLANIMGLTAIGIMLLLFLPVYFFTGIRRAETKVNAIVTSVLIVAGAGLLMALIRSPKSSTQLNILNTSYYLLNEQILKNEQKLVASYLKADSAQEKTVAQSQKINQLCEELKKIILEKETGYKTLDANFENKNALLTESRIEDHFTEGTTADSKLTSLRKLVETYNQDGTSSANSGFQSIPVKGTILDRKEFRTLNALNSLFQIQMLILQNEQVLLAGK